MAASTPTAVRRIVSLVPSATETVFRLGAGDQLVGRSHVCNEPPEAAPVPALTRPRLTQTSSRGIHDDLRQRLAEGLAIYDVDLDRLRALEPTHLLVQDQCSVCAVSPAALEEALADWLGTPPSLLALAPHQLIDVWQDIDRIGRAIGRAEQSDALRTELSDRISGIVEAVGPAAPRPRVACIEWIEPIMIAGHWIPELVRIAGGEPILSEIGGASRTVDLETLVAAAPDVVIVQPCGFDLDKSLREWRQAPEIEEKLAQLRTTRLEPPRVVVTDGDAFFNRPGPRLVESAEILAEALHPDRLGRSHAGRDWIELDVRA